MFPHTENRIGTLLRRTVDAAIDFATLGEYGLASAMDLPDEPVARLAPMPPRSDILSVALAPPAVPAAPVRVAAAPDLEAFRMQAISAAAKARQVTHAPAPCAVKPVRRGPAPARPDVKSRERAGSAPRTEQLCFYID